MTKPGFTLLEMLISVAIFSGLVILILSIFVRTASSQARVNVLREKSEVARSAMSRIKNDFQYLYMDKAVTLGDPGDNGRVFKGYYIDNSTGSNDVVMLLKYPNKGDGQFVYKRYSTERTGVASRSRTFNIREFRDCSVDANGNLFLTTTTSACRFNSVTNQSVLPEGYLLDDRTVFSGLEPDANPLRTGFLKLALNIKPAEYEAAYCSASSVPDGACYKVETILTAGGIN